MSDDEKVEEPRSTAGPARKDSDDEAQPAAKSSKVEAGSLSESDDNGTSGRDKSLPGESDEDEEKGEESDSDDDDNRKKDSSEEDTETRESEKKISSAEASRLQRERVATLRAGEMAGEGGEAVLPEKYKITPDPFVDEMREKYLARAGLEPPQIGPLLASQLMEEDIDTFFEAFKASKDGYLDEESFKSILLATGRISLTAEEYKTLFLRMDTNNDKKVGWDEFLTFIMFESQEQDMARENMDLDVPLSGFPRVVKSRHHFPIIRTTFMPVMDPDRSVSLLKGRYITASRDGLIRYWTLDLDPEGSAWVKSITPRKNPSWVTDIVSMPDLHVLCVTSTEREIRFYDVKAVRFDLRVMITRLPESVTCMNYYFPKEASRDSLLITGDVGGSVRIYCFYTEDINPFYCTDGSMLKVIPYFKVLKGGMRNVSVLEYLQIHNDWVKQVGYSSRVRSFISCATTDENSLIMWGLHHDDKPQRYNARTGITCFSLCEETHLIVTGCMNGVVLVWDAWLPGKSTAEFLGHKGPIVLVVFQQMGRRLYSMSKDRCIKVWDVPKHMCIQTYNGMPSDNANLSPSYFYNSTSRLLVVASHKICVLLLGPALDTSRSDGYTHTMPVVRALYNPLYKSVATVGMDSFIMIWNLWEGRRMLFIKEAHTRNYYGVPVPVEITSATLDPSYQNLVTGARDGTIKVWDFNMGICVRVLNIDLFCEVTNIVWVPGRILAVGWDRNVTEFYEDSPENTGKVWETRHSDDIQCMAYRKGQSVATSSYNGELVLWRLETGQAYKRFIVGSPGTRIILTYTSKATRKGSTSVLQAGTPYAISIRERDYMSPYAFHKTSLYTGVHPFMTSNVKTEQVDLIVGDRGTLRRASSSAIATQRHGSRVWPAHMVGTGGLLSSASLASARRASQAALEAIGRRRSSLSASSRSGLSEAPDVPPAKRARRVSYVQVPVAEKPTSATAVLFLETRPMDRETGTLFVATDKGIIQVWSHHALGQCLGDFLAIHMAGDYVTCMCTDEENDYLFTGTSQGFIKVWLLKNYAFPNCDKVRVCMPVMRLLFPFLWHDRIEGRAKRSLRGQPKPVLLNSYRGHLMAITSIQYIKDYNVVMTASSDSSVRLWAVSGRYLGTLGGARTWDAFQDNYGRKFVEFRNEDEYMVPPDVKQVMSSTTFKVLVEGNLSHASERTKEDQLLVGTMPDKVRVRATHGHRVGVPVLGKYITVPEDEPTEPPPQIMHDRAARKVCVYHLLRTKEMEEVVQPSMPQTLLYQKRILGKKKFEMPSRFVPKRSLPKVDFGADHVEKVAAWMARQTMVDTKKRRSTLMQGTKAWEQRRKSARPSMRYSFVKEARSVAKSLKLDKMNETKAISLTGRRRKSRRKSSDAIRFEIGKMRSRSSRLSRAPPRPKSPFLVLASPPPEPERSESRPSSAAGVAFGASPSISDRGSVGSNKGLDSRVSLSDVRTEMVDWLLDKMQGHPDRASVMNITDQVSDWLVEAGTKTGELESRYSIMSLRGRITNQARGKASVNFMKDHIAEFLLGVAGQGKSAEEMALWRRLSRLAAARKALGVTKPMAGPELSLHQRLKALQREKGEQEAAKRRDTFQQQWRARHSSFDSWGEPPSPPSRSAAVEGGGMGSARSSRMADHWPPETHPSQVLTHRGRYPGKGPVRLQWSYGRPEWQKMRDFKEQLKIELLDRALPYSKSRAHLPTAQQIKRKQVREDMRQFVMGTVNFEIEKRAGITDDKAGKKEKDTKEKGKGKKGKKKGKKK